MHEHLKCTLLLLINVNSIKHHRYLFKPEILLGPRGLGRSICLILINFEILAEKCRKFRQSSIITFPSSKPGFYGVQKIRRDSSDFLGDREVESRINFILSLCKFAVMDG